MKEPGGPQPPPRNIRPAGRGPFQVSDSGSRQDPTASPPAQLTHGAGAQGAAATWVNTLRTRGSTPHPRSD